MLRTLFLVPHEIAGIPVFGIGWILGALVVAAIAVTLFLVARKQDVKEFWLQNATLLAIAMAIVVFVLPRVELPSVSGQPAGMAVRGYGVMMLLGITASIALAVARGRRYGISDDVMLGIAPALIAGGLIGARLFYVIEYRDQYITDNLLTTIGKLLNFTQGGLVVYGSFIGGFLAGVAYVLWKRLPLLTMGDVIVPCLFIGLSLGRLGCFMNGCCYGGACEPSWSALNFPNGSPVYEDQLSSGLLAGLSMDPQSKQVVAVGEGSVAAKSGITVGATVEKLTSVRSVEEAKPTVPMEEAPLGLLAVIDGKEYYWPASALPARANPVAPTQILSSIGGLLLCISLCWLSRFVIKPGRVMLIGFASYAVLRFVMEMLRNDEPGQFGTTLTIAQWVSIVVFSLSILAIIWLTWFYREFSRGPELKSEV